jgi:hypothetical protein
LTLLALLGLATPAVAQQQATRALTTADYARAERFLSANTTPLVFGATIRPTWLDDDRLWYRNTIPEGAEFILADAASGTRDRAFDHSRLAAALSTASGNSHTAFALPFTTFEFTDGGRAITFDVRNRGYSCNIVAYTCSPAADRGAANRNAIVSPDGTRAAYIQDYNLWVQDVTTSEAWPLTTDGVKDFGYATDNAGWTKSERPVLLWSPDSRKIATFQHESRPAKCGTCWTRPWRRSSNRATGASTGIS